MGNQVFWDYSGQADGNIRSISQVYCNITSSGSGEIILQRLHFTCIEHTEHIPHRNAQCLIALITLRDIFKF
jgi:hypothetical protein